MAQLMFREIRVIFDYVSITKRKYEIIDTQKMYYCFTTIQDNRHQNKSHSIKLYIRTKTITYLFILLRIV